MRNALRAGVIGCVLAAAAFCALQTIEGRPSAAVEVAIYEDLQAPGQPRFRDMLDNRIMPAYASKVKFIHYDFPQPGHDWARAAAMAARWVSSQRQSLGIEFRRELASEQAHIDQANLADWAVGFARRNHLDEKGIVAALTDGSLGSEVDQDAVAARARGIKSAPAMYIDGHIFSGSIVGDQVAAALDAALVPH